MRTERRGRLTAPALSLVMLGACADTRVESESAWGTAHRASEEPARVVPVAPSPPHLEEPGPLVVEPGPPTSPHRRVRFERVATELPGHEVRVPTTTAHEIGVTLLDFDGDGDLDVFLGAATFPSRACVHENVSEPGVVELRRREDWCFDPLAESATALDVDADGAHELVLVSQAGLYVVQNGAAPVRLADGEGGACFGLTALAYDVDLDGALDIVAGCLRIEAGQAANGVWLRRGDGWTAMPSDEVTAVVSNEAGATIGLGALDVDADGLIDLLEVNDTFSTRGRRNTTLQPGGVRFRCAPDEACRSVFAPLGEGLSQYASLMGVGVAVAGADEVLLWTDWGPVQAFTASGRELQRRDTAALGLPSALEHLSAAERGAPAPVPRFSWGVLADDFDDDGLDDVLVIEGAVIDFGLETIAPHRSFVALQSGDGTFEPVTDPLLPVSPGDDPMVLRGVARGDLDGDGRVELVVAPGLGEPVVLTQTAPLRDVCTLMVAPRVVPSWGYGYAVWTPARGWRRWDVQGQSRSTGAPWLVAPASAGRVRFPSGYEASFDCAGERRVRVAEPEWLAVAFTGAEARVTLSAPMSMTRAALRRGDEVEVRVLGGRAEATLALDTSVDAVMLEVDGRWVGRWWPREE